MPTPNTVSPDRIRSGMIKINVLEESIKKLMAKGYTRKQATIIAKRKMAASGYPTQSTTDYYESSIGEYGPLMSYQDGSLGAYGPLRAQNDGILGALGSTILATTPIVAAARLARASSQYRLQAASGLGSWGLGAEGDEVEAPPETEPTPVVDNQSSAWRDLGYVAAAVMLGMGLLSYQAGKAMAPNRAQARAWGWVGVPVGMLTGPWGLGLMGIVSNSKRK